MSLSQKNKEIWLKTVEKLISIDFCVVHPLKGKDRLRFFVFLVKIMSRHLGFASEKHKILFFIGKNTENKTYNHLYQKNRRKRKKNQQKFQFYFFYHLFEISSLLIFQIIIITVYFEKFSKKIFHLAQIQQDLTIFTRFHNAGFGLILFKQCTTGVF